MNARRLLLTFALLFSCKENGVQGNPPPAHVSATPSANASPKAAHTANAPGVNPETELPRLLALTSELARVHSEHGNRCDALVNALRAWNDQHGAELRAISQATYGAAERNAAAQAQLARDFERVMDAGMRCRTSPDFQRLQAELASRREAKPE